ncbi:HepT-like ribonuclease domain-containing protein [Agromyces neolithicus]|uniref:DUF86 domain-containing protein n=1 Tax=Agromyces neolithicus TaxID=269420 RepID=A0ABN2M393_9MICO
MQHDDRNVRDELERVLRRLDAVAASARNEFVDGSSSYDAASMAVIRMAALLEDSATSKLADRLTEDEVRGIRTMRNIAAHGGYVGMDDDVLWRAVTVQLPQLVRGLLADE